MSWDFAFKGESDSDYVVGQVWARRKSEYFLLDQVRFQGDFVKTLDEFQRLCNKWPQVGTKIIEDAANGPAIHAMLRKSISGIIPVKAKDSKLARVSAISPLIESGNVWIPSQSNWREDFLHECAMFPRGANDDMVDAMSQALVRFEKSRRQGIRYIMYEIV